MTVQRGGASLCGWGWGRRALSKERDESFSGDLGPLLRPGLRNYGARLEARQTAFSGQVSYTHLERKSWKALKNHWLSPLVLFMGQRLVLFQTVV